MSDWVIGIIGGSGLYEIDALENARWEKIDSPFGAPSDDIYRGRMNGIDLVFLPRHGRGHHIPPSDLNYRANIDVLKRAGVTDILSLSACGSLQEAYAPGDFVLVDQFIDRTKSRASSFFGPGCVAHISMAHPVCERLRSLAEVAAQKAGANTHSGGVYLAMEGPQFSTLAESRLYRGWGCDVIGMTNMPEAKLAREAELPYASVAMVTDYDCWREESENVSVTNVLQVLKDNADTARRLILHLTEALANTPRTPSPQNIETGLDYALVTAPEARDPEIMARLDAVAGRVLG